MTQGRNETVGAARVRISRIWHTRPRDQGKLLWWRWDGVHNERLREDTDRDRTGTCQRTSVSAEESQGWTDLQR